MIKAIFTFKRLFLGLIILNGFLCWAVVKFPSAEYVIHFFNVGQGDGFYIQTLGRRIVVDGGPNESILRELADLIPPWDRHIDMLFLTHPHADHVTGALSVLKNYRVDYVVHNLFDFDSPVYADLQAYLTNNHIRVVPFIQGDRIQLGETQILSLWPNDPCLETDVNFCSQVMLLTYNNVRILFTGDAELGQVEIANAVKSIGQIELLKVPHQGSQGAVSKDVLEILLPKWGVIPVGKNSYGHPSQDTIQMIQNAKAKVYRTDFCGEIKMIIKNSDVKVDMSKQC